VLVLIYGKYLKATHIPQETVLLTVCVYMEGEGDSKQHKFRRNQYWFEGKLERPTRAKVYEKRYTFRRNEYQLLNYWIILKSNTYSIGICTTIMVIYQSNTYSTESVSLGSMV
jgi:hypothetical protein